MSLRDHVFDRIPNWDQGKVSGARVLVVGAGALGNEVLKNLALLNVQRLVIMDFDRVEVSNLSRAVLFRQEDADQGRYKALVAAERLVEINSELEVLVLLGDVVTDLSLGLLDAVDVVIGCVDNRLARLYLNRLCWRAGKPWVDGGILNLSGQVAAYVPGASCYECGLTAAAWAEIRQRLGCTDMARRYAMDGHAPTTPLAASILGALQVQEALKLVLGLGEVSLASRMFSYEGHYLHAAVYEQQPLREVCESHFPRHEVVTAPLSAATRVAEVLAYLRDALGMASPCLQLDHSLALRLAALDTGRGEDVVLPLPHFSDAVAAWFSQRHGGPVAVPRGALTEEVRPGSGLDACTLSDLGIPYGHVLRAGRPGERRLVALGADLPLFSFSKGIRQLPNVWWERSPEAVRMAKEGP